MVKNISLYLQRPLRSLAEVERARRVQPEPAEAADQPALHVGTLTG